MTAYHLRVSLNYATHLAALMRAFDATDGDVLELGMGVFSTPYLHYACQRAGRKLVSYENGAAWAGMFTEADAGYRRDWHEINVVADWDAARLRHRWGLALVDHSPSERRHVDIARLAKWARIIVAHDSNHHLRYDYHYQRIYPLFKYRADWTGDHREAVVLSNFVDLGGFWG